MLKPILTLYTAFPIIRTPCRAHHHLTKSHALLFSRLIPVPVFSRLCRSARAWVLERLTPGRPFCPNGPTVVRVVCRKRMKISGAPEHLPEALLQFGGSRSDNDKPKIRQPEDWRPWEIYQETFGPACISRRKSHHQQTPETRSPQNRPPPPPSQCHTTARPMFSSTPSASFLSVFISVT